MVFQEFVCQHKGVSCTHTGEKIAVGEKGMAENYDQLRNGTGFSMKGYDAYLKSLETPSETPSRRRSRKQDDDS